MNTETWVVVGNWGSIEIEVSPIDDKGRWRSEKEKRRIASLLAFQDRQIGDDIRSAEPIGNPDAA